MHFTLMLIHNDSGYRSLGKLSRNILFLSQARKNVRECSNMIWRGLHDHNSFERTLRSTLKPIQTIPNPSEPIQTSGCSGCSKHFKTKKQKSSALSLRSSRNDEDLNHFRHTWESHGVPESQSEFRPASPHKQKRLEKHVLDNNDNIWIFGCYMMLFLIFF
jgi:hypothetical protein